MFQISLRQLFLLVAAIALAIVSLKYASPVWRGAIGFATMLCVFYAAIAAILDRGVPQAFAIGAVVAMLGYSILVRNEQLIERDSLDRLPTTHFIGYLYQSVRSVLWVDEATGKVISTSAASPTQPAALSPGGRVVPMEVPDHAAFLRIGHYWIALLLGCVGGQFARFIYLRRLKGQAARSKD